MDSGTDEDEMMNPAGAAGKVDAVAAAAAVEGGENEEERLSLRVIVWATTMTEPDSCSQG